MLQRASGARFLWMGLFELLLLATENTPLLSFSLLVQTFPSSRLELLPKLLRSSQNYSSPNKHFLPSSSSSTSTPLLLLKRLPPERSTLLLSSALSLPLAASKSSPSSDVRASNSLPSPPHYLHTLLKVFQFFCFPQSYSSLIFQILWSLKGAGKLVCNSNSLWKRNFTKLKENIFL